MTNPLRILMLLRCGVKIEKNLRNGSPVVSAKPRKSSDLLSSVPPRINTTICLRIAPKWWCPFCNLTNESACIKTDNTHTDGKKSVSSSKSRVHYYYRTSYRRASCRAFYFSSLLPLSSISDFD